MDTLEQIIPYLWNVYSQTLLVVIALGYVIRAIPVIPNKWIPPLGIVTGTVFFTLTSASLNQPVVSRVGVGLILAVAAWMAHLLVISRIEDWLASKIPAVDRIMKATADKTPALIACGLLGATLLFTPGCAVFTGKSPVTYDATRFQSFQDVWTVTRKAYEAHLLQVARGKVSIADQQDINRAWNAYRSAYLIALDLARNNEQAYTPENVRKLADDLLTLIAAL